MRTHSSLQCGVGRSEIPPGHLSVQAFSQIRARTEPCVIPTQRNLDLAPSTSFPLPPHSYFAGSAVLVDAASPAALRSCADPRHGELLHVILFYQHHSDLLEWGESSATSRTSLCGSHSATLKPMEGATRGKFSWFRAPLGSLSRENKEATTESQIKREKAGVKIIEKTRNC